jgi:hypothetical protein
VLVRQICEMTLESPIRPEVPSVIDFYRLSWPILWQRFAELLVLSILWWLLGLPAGLSDGSFSRAVSLSYQVLVLGPLSFGGIYAYLETVRGRRPEIGLLFTAFQRCYWPSVLANFLLFVTIMVGFALLLVPGVFLAVRLAFVPFLVVDERRDPADAFRESWRRTAPIAWTVFGVMLLAVPIALAGVLLLVVGVIPAFMWINLALARLYAEATQLDRRHPTIELG